MTRREAILSAVGIFAGGPRRAASWSRARSSSPSPRTRPTTSAWLATCSRGAASSPMRCGATGRRRWSSRGRRSRSGYHSRRFLAAIPMALLGTTFAAAQWSSVIAGAIVPVLAWRLAADVAVERGLPPGPRPDARGRDRPDRRGLPAAPPPLRPARLDDAVRGPRPGVVPGDVPHRRRPARRPPDRPARDRPRRADRACRADPQRGALPRPRLGHRRLGHPGPGPGDPGAADRHGRRRGRAWSSCPGRSATGRRSAARSPARP